MRTMEDLDAWYEDKINQVREEAKQKAEQKAKLEAKLEVKREIAIKLLRENIAIEIVAEVTEITISEVEGFANDRPQ